MIRTITDREQIRQKLVSFPLEAFFSFDAAPYTHIVEFQPEEIILKENELPAYLYFLFEGNAKLFITHANGKSSLISFISAPSFLGEMELIGAQSTANGIKATSFCLCFAIDTALCKEKLLNDIKFLRHICLSLGQKAAAGARKNSKLQSYPLENRLAAFILLTAHNGIYREKHTEAAEYLGVSYRHLLYVLADFIQKGLLEKKKGGYLLLEQEKLERLARM